MNLQEKVPGGPASRFREQVLGQAVVYLPGPVQALLARGQEKYTAAQR